MRSSGRPRICVSSASVPRLLQKTSTAALALEALQRRSTTTWKWKRSGKTTGMNTRPLKLRGVLTTRCENSPFRWCKRPLVWPASPCEAYLALVWPVLPWFGLSSLVWPDLPWLGLPLLCRAPPALPGLALWFYHNVFFATDPSTLRFLSYDDKM